MITIPCRKCGSSKLHKNGDTKAGQQKDHCQTCGFYGTLQTKDEERAAKWAFGVEKLQRERLSQRAIARLTGLSRSTIIKRLKKSPRNQPIAVRILPSLKRSLIEMDELWSYIQSKAKRVWVWLAIERQTRKIVGITFGNRSEETCSTLWASLPADYRKRAMGITDGLLN